MPVKKPLFNIGRMIDESVKEVPIETSFLDDLNYTVNKLISAEHQPVYFWKKISSISDDSISDDSIPIYSSKSEFDEPCEKNLGSIVKIVKNSELCPNFYQCTFHDGKPSRTYKPSSLQCIRQMYYQMTGCDLDESSNSPDMCGVGESGTDRHIRIQNYIEHMKDYGIDCEYVDVEKYVAENNIPDIKIIGKQGMETKLHNTKYNLNFLCDGIIKYKGNYYILEIKTESSYKWRDRTGVADEHILQASTYSKCLNLSSVLFLYECRDFCSKKSYVLNVTTDMQDFVCDKILLCDQYVNSNIVPPKPSDVSKKSCQYCSYRKTCKKDV